jgi:hypothetical protein
MFQTLHVSNMFQTCFKTIPETCLKQHKKNRHTETCLKHTRFFVVDIVIRLDLFQSVSKCFNRFWYYPSEKKSNETNPSPCSRAFPCRLCVCAPFTNVELEMWIQCYGKFSCELRYLLQSLLDNFVSSHFSGSVNLLSTAGLATAQLNHAEKTVNAHIHIQTINAWNLVV